MRVLFLAALLALTVAAADRPDARARDSWLLGV